MCNNCRFAFENENRLMCMCEESESQYKYVHKYDVCDSYKVKCKHMKEDGICLKGASSTGMCQKCCSHYETLKG